MVKKSKVNKVLLVCIIGLLVITTLFTGCGKSQGTSQTSDNNEKISNDKPVVFVSWGGSFQEIFENIILKPFKTETGIDYLSVSPTDYGKIKAMVSNEQVEWDVVDVGGGTPIKMKDFFELLDYNVIDTTGIDEKYIYENGIALQTYSDVIGWNTDAFGENGPKTWSEFWDVEKFPGPRALYKEAAATIECALLADGISRDEMYPLTPEKIDRAFKKLDEIKPHVSVWWETGAQPAQLLADGTVVAAYGWNGRFQQIKKENAPVDFTYNDGLLHFGCLVVPKDAPNKDAAMKLIAYMLKPEVQAKLTEATGYGGSNSLLFKHMDEKAAQTINTYPENAKVQLIFDEAWWGVPENRDPIEARFKEWLMK